MPKGATRASLSSYCVAVSTASVWSPRSAIGLTDTRGNINGTALPSSLTAVTLPYVKQVVDSGKPVVSELTTGPISGKPTIVMAYPVHDASQALVVHAVATPYRERSHFDGQDVLESGLPGPGTTDTGWLNRALSALAPGEPMPARGRQAFAIGPITPLVMRGPAPVLSWMPPRLPPVSDDTVMRLLDLYRHTDPVFAGVLEERIGVSAIAHAGGMDTKPADGSPAVQTGGIAQVRAYFAEAAGAAASTVSAAGAAATTAALAPMMPKVPSIRRRLTFPSRFVLISRSFSSYPQDEIVRRSPTP